MSGPDELPWELPHGFLGLTGEASSLAHARAVILPVPYEATTSWGGGTRCGPRSIIEASRYVELHDQELDANPSAVGIHTFPALELTRAGPSEAASELLEAYRRVLEATNDRFVVMLGGEHSITPPAVWAWAERLEQPLTVLQLDAHADLRPAYEGTPYSHASAMARVLEQAKVVAVGVRAVSAEEVEMVHLSDRVAVHYADHMWRDDSWMQRALAALDEHVYLTLDVDYFDPSLVPATGTPEPGGGEWYPTLAFLRRVFSERNVVACDIVELAPIPGLKAPDFLVAKLVYKLLGYRFEQELKRGGSLESPAS